MRKLYEKSEITFAIVWIVVYCILLSLANPLNKIIGTEYSASAVLCILQTVILFIFIRKNSLWKRYGLCKSSAPARRFLYYVPLFILATRKSLERYCCQLFAIGNCLSYYLYALRGIYRGSDFQRFLFKAMAKDNLKFAIIISSVTFGVGHLVNLFNGSGMDLVSNLCQICFAIAVGFLFVTIFYRGGSLLLCIITHSAINTFSTFANEVGFTVEKHIICVLVMTVLTVAYTLILTKTLPENQCANAIDKVDK